MSNSFARSIAVVIGINEYQNGIDLLQTAVPDAVEIAKILRDNYQYQFVHFLDCETGVIENQYATKDNLETLLTDILPNQIKPTKSDRLIFYFAGHGIARNSDEGPEGYLVPQDADRQDRQSLLAMGYVHDRLAKLECRHLLEHRFSNTKNYFFGYSDNEISAFENSRNPKYGLDSEY